jgi:hypothetical protein
MYRIVCRVIKATVPILRYPCLIASSTPDHRKTVSHMYLFVAAYLDKINKCEAVSYSQS